MSSFAASSGRESPRSIASFPIKGPFAIVVGATVPRYAASRALSVLTLNCRQCAKRSRSCPPTSTTSGTTTERRTKRTIPAHSIRRVVRGSPTRGREVAGRA
jgi:hypothetical protein